MTLGQATRPQVTSLIPGKPRVCTLLAQLAPCPVPLVAGMSSGPDMPKLSRYEGTGHLQGGYVVPLVGHRPADEAWGHDISPGWHLPHQMQMQAPSSSPAQILSSSALQRFTDTCFLPQPVQGTRCTGRLRHSPTHGCSHGGASLGLWGHRGCQGRLPRGGAGRG